MSWHNHDEIEMGKRFPERKPTKTTAAKELPNGINLQKLSTLLAYSDRYEISIQFWPEQTAVYLAKDGVDLNDWGGDFDHAVSSAIGYLERVTKS